MQLRAWAWLAERRGPADGDEVPEVVDAVAETMTERGKAQGEEAEAEGGCEVVARSFRAGSVGAC
eukprot:11278185-Prorocentrum_lima.AAC.1